MLSVQVGDLNISYEKMGKGPLLVLLHGWANTWEAWLPVIPSLADHFTLILPDLPGFGQSEGPIGGWSTHEYTLWLSSFLREIQKTYPNRYLFIAGHSFGGKIASYYTSQDFSPHIDKLVIIDASGIPGKLNSKQRVLKLMALATPPFLKKTIAKDIRSKLYKTFDADSDYLQANEAQRHTLRKILPENIIDRLAQIEIPTLILWGKRDPATPFSAGLLFHTHIRGSTLLQYESGHFPHHEHPQRVAADITEFLERKTQTHIISNTETKPELPTIRRRPMQQTLTTQLAILQQSEYEWGRFQDWLSHQTSIATIEPKKWTTKLTLIANLTHLTTTILGEHISLWWWNTCIKIPQYVYFFFVVSLATAKLRVLQSKGLTVICIAGSYAKTSTKYTMHHVFSAAFPTLMTPENINTPFGIARVILHDLSPRHRFFIAELGEYYPGDIASLTAFLRPAYKILTPVGFAHLERFQTTERLEKGLMELVTTHPRSPAFVHEKNKHLVERYANEKNIHFYGNTQLTHIIVSRAGTEFDVHLPASTLHVFIPLLGAHNADNTLPTILLATLLGIDEKVITGRLQTLPQVPHRLEPTLLEHNILLLDNGYNSNPASAKESLTVLQALPGSQKIVITPGFVEMGSAQEKENELFGEVLAGVCDYVGVVTGANEVALLSGLTKAQFPPNRIIMGSSEIDVMNKLQSHIKPNAIILFENSITDVYKR